MGLRDLLLHWSMFGLFARSDEIIPVSFTTASATFVRSMTSQTSFKLVKKLYLYFDARVLFDSRHQIIDLDVGFPEKNQLRTTLT